LKEEGWSSLSQIPPITLTYSSSGIQTTKDEVAELLKAWKNVLKITVNANDIDSNTLSDDASKGDNNPLSFYSAEKTIS
jgi:peptide/nickel transport system substrate-binding protein/oligopeptide transport system substrate-binding protein